MIFLSAAKLQIQFIKIQCLSVIFCGHFAKKKNTYYHHGYYYLRYNSGALTFEIFLYIVNYNIIISGF